MPAEVPRNMANAFARSNSVTVGNRDVALLHSAAVGRGPISDLAVDGDTVVVANFGDDSLAVLDAETLTVHGGIFAGQPTTVVVSDTRAFVAVSSASYDAIAVVDTVSGDVVKEYPLSFNVTAVTSSTDGKRVYAGRAGENGVDVAVIDVTAERVGTIYVAKGADATIDALRLDASGRRLYVGVSDARTSRLITVDIESARVRRTLEIGAPIRGLELGIDGTAYVLTSDIADGGVLHFVDLVNNRISGAITVARTPTQLAIGQDGARAYVVDYDHVAVVDTDDRSVVATLEVGARPSALAVSADRLYVADYDGGVTSYAVASPTPMLYAQFVAAPSLVAPAARELTPAGV
jgi:YVTN family beta-propeller protein